MSITINTGLANTLHDPLGSKAAAPKNGASSFQAHIATAAVQFQEKTSDATASDAGNAAAFDPFAVVRSGAVSESNGFVLALEHLYGIAQGSITGIQIPSATTVDAMPASKADVKAEPAKVDAMPTPDQPTGQAIDLSKMISTAVEQSAASLPGLGVTQAMLSKMG